MGFFLLIFFLSIFLTKLSWRQIMLLFKLFGKITGGTEAAVVSDFGNVAGGVDQHFLRAFQTIVVDVFDRGPVCE